MEIIEKKISYNKIRMMIDDNHYDIVKKYNFIVTYKIANKKFTHNSGDIYDSEEEANQGLNNFIQEKQNELDEEHKRGVENFARMRKEAGYGELPDDFDITPYITNAGGFKGRR